MGAATSSQESFNKSLLEELLHEDQSLRDNSRSAAHSERARVAASALRLSRVTQLSSPDRYRIRAPAIGTVHLQVEPLIAPRCLLGKTRAVYGAHRETTCVAELIRNPCVLSKHTDARLTVEGRELKDQGSGHTPNTRKELRRRDHT